MTRKDFIFIADVLKSMPTDNGATRTEIVVMEFANRLGETNHRFNKQLFIQAATGVVALTARKAVA